MKAKSVAAVLLACVLATPFAAFADRGHGRHGGWRGGAHPGYHRHFHHYGPVIGFGIVGAPAFFYPGYAPYVYAVPAAPQQPPLYIEQFIGEPSPGMTGVVCPSQNLAPYPQVLSCPGGWARIVAAPPAG
jgi:hypothetical protein